MSGAFHYVLGPESPADAKDWPRTPKDAAQGVVDGQDRPGSGARVLGGDGSRSALIVAVLSVDDDDCVYVARRGDDSPDNRIYATWPAGCSATLDDDRNLTLLDNAGDPVAYGGERLAMSGGYGPNPSTEPCLPGSATRIANIGSEVEVRGP